MQIKPILFASGITFALCIVVFSVQAGTLVISNATLIDGTGAAPQEDMTIVIEDELVQSVGTNTTEIKDARHINAKGRFVMPGLVDMHTHPTFEIRQDNPSMPFPEPTAMPSSDEEMREFIEKRLPGRMLKFLHAGVTTVVAAGGYWPFDIEVRERQYAGDFTGPRLLVASPIFTAPGGHPASGICSHKTWCADRLSVQVADASSAREAVRHFARGGVQGIKLVYDSFNKTHLGGPDFDFPRLDKDVMAAIVLEAGKLGLPVVAHTKTVAETADAVHAGVDALVHSALQENPDFTTPTGEYLPQLVASHKLTMTTTVRSFYQRLKTAPAEKMEQAKRNFALLEPSLRAYDKAGVTLLFGTDFDGAGLDPDPAVAVRSEASALVAAGFSELEVIKMATGNAWKHPMVPVNLGSIEPGKIADLLILRGDPIRDIKAITQPDIVIKSGVVVTK